MSQYYETLYQDHDRIDKPDSTNDIEREHRVPKVQEEKAIKVLIKASCADKITAEMINGTEELVIEIFQKFCSIV